MKNGLPGYSRRYSLHGKRPWSKLYILCCFCLLGGQQIAMAQNAYGLSLDIAGLPSDPNTIVWERLPLLKGERIVIFKGVEKKTAFSHQPSIFHYKDKFFAAWCNGAIAEDSSEQRVLYATSKDGYKWSKPTSMTGSIAGRQFVPSGFCVRNGQLFAFASGRNSRGSSLPANEVIMLAYQWNETKNAFTELGVIAKDFLGIDGPRQVADGQWLMFGKPRPESSPAERANKFAKGGKDALDQWTIKLLPNNDVEHDIAWYALADDNLLSIEASGQVPNRRLISMYSNDQGSSWTQPVSSNFPDADSRLYGLKLSNGRYVLLNNPNLSRYRIPLSIAISSDGRKFDRMANIRIEQTNKKYSGHAKAPGYQYVRAMEHDGKLWIIYSVNKENVEITTITLEEIDRLYTTEQTYDNRKPPAEIIVDNGDKGFTTSPAWSNDTVTSIYDGLRMAYYGADYAKMTGANAAGGWAKWTPGVQRAGVYAVYMKWAQIGFGTRSPMPDVAPVEIKHGGGIAKTSVDQTRYGGTWIYLGSFTMKPGDDSYVKIYSVNNKITIADAVKFVMTE